MSGTNSPRPRSKPFFSHWGAMLAVLVISLTTTVLGWKYEENRVLEVRQTQFDRSSQILKDDIVNAMIAYAQFLRTAVGFMHASDDVDRLAWRQYVNDAQLSENYPGILGIGFNPFISDDVSLQAAMERALANGLDDFQIKPPGPRSNYAPVLFLEPLTVGNEKAIGFDIYSEDLRRAAVDRAIATGRAAMTAKITLVQENGVQGDDSVQAGILLMVPTFANGVIPVSASDRRTAATGLVVSVFRMGDLITNVYARRGEAPHQRISLNLYDDKNTLNPDAQLFGDTFDKQLKDRNSLFNRTVVEDMFGRPWTFQLSSTPAFERETTSASPMIVLGAGLLLSMLMTSLVWGQSQRAYETELMASELASNQNHIEFLMGEVNHRSKNLLSLVQAIARQTKSDDPGQFVSQFSERVRALAANQDLLVRNGWKGISMHDLISSQLAHFEGILGNRILLNGPHIDINAEASQTLGMAFHELATNAGKYGALSNSSGTVDIEWAIIRSSDQEDMLELAWLENGGPRVVAPEHKGFGTKVTDLMATFSLGGTVESLYEPAGFKWRISCPTHKVFEGVPDLAERTVKGQEFSL